MFRGVFPRLFRFRNVFEKNLLKISRIQCLILISSAASALSLCDSHWTVHAESFYQSTTDLSKDLRNRLSLIRSTLQKNQSQIPEITVHDIKEPISTQVITIRFSPDCNIVQFASQWLKLINPQSKGSVNDKHLTSICKFYSDPMAMTLPIVGENGKSSMTFMKSMEPIRGTNKRDVRVSVAVFKDEGFSSADIDHLVAGYDLGFSPIGDRKGLPMFRYNPSSDWSSKGRNILDFILDDDFPHSLLSPDGTLPSSPRQEAPASGRSMGNKVGNSIVDAEPELSEEERRRAQAVSALQGMGVEVFDRERNALLTWDSLAGYSHVKQSIEDTIVNALQFPEIYDSVASRTRVVPESNRPKAVLLEGPPGTGKTLTARILASQCDRPLVVLKLESVVSKWYGDSEKKLAQMFDACDSLEGAILFVDEIDSLAQSRESEAGIHEVSKRILAILLQRIEGFHGKGRSVLVCATNRKQDLDKALLSRFDLVIPFDLPDRPTRHEILRRYAKQFEAAAVRAGDENPYSVMAAATEGMSCRAIKEVCEQAERVCASRLVAEHKRKLLAKESPADGSSVHMFSLGGLLGGGKKDSRETATSKAPSEVPQLADYLQCIAYRTNAATDALIAATNGR